MINLSRSFLWRKLREIKILRAHKRIAGICEALVKAYDAAPVHYDFAPKHSFPNGRIIWQYWAQGYDSVPAVVRRCLDSVNLYAADYTIIRLSDSNLDDYLDIPDFIQTKRERMTVAHFSDLLRLMLLKTYGGIWMDATVLLTGPIPEAYARQDFFVFQRDPDEPDYKYWRNVYAYYFGWAKGFRVNMLSSFMVAKQSGVKVSRLCDLCLYWWRHNDYLPDYFFLQILYDVVVYPDKDCPMASDTRPHYLQQSINDPRFRILDRETIERTIPIHKLTYK